MPELSITEAKELLPKISHEVKLLRDEFKITASLADLESSFTFAEENIQPESVVLMAKIHLQQLIPRYELAFPLFADLPPHARIGIDVFGTHYDIPRHEVTLLEASLFEDMASLWNLMQEIPAAIEDDPLSDIQRFKSLKAIQRSTVRSSFALIEGYINGIAIDTYLTRDLTEDEQSKVSEWDIRNDRPNPMNLRSKLLQYPKIALGLKHPPLTEQKFNELNRLIEIEKRLRHALIHPNPRERRQDPDYREAVYFDTDREEVDEIVTLVEAVIRRINELLDGQFGSVGFWLYSRNSEGIYPKSVFH